ncbi:MAG: peptide chain release factor N(5)-glutamine methyltransferase, partial [Bacteroidales bacterium]|nr:peptide chain release factor N(5)-glutamine methyltransferase [Bacteroidales bacterium]
YVLGYADFLGMRLRVTPDVLIPRPETEELCRRVIASYSSGSAAPRAILDLCCGSGCITWVMARAFPDALVVGVDLSAEALAVARSQNPMSENSASPASPSAASSQSIHAPAAPAEAPTPVFIQSDVLNVSDLVRTLKSVLKEHACSGFDLLLSNPPYVREQERAEMARNVLDFEPSMALFVPDDDALLFYRAIRDVWFSSLLRPQSRLALELNEALGPETAALFSPALPRQDASNSAFPRLEKDFNEKNRYFFAEK